MYFSFQPSFDAPFCLVSLIKVGYHYHKGILHLNRHLKNSLEKSIVIDDSIFCLNLFAGISTTNNMINKTGWVQYQDCCKLCRLALFGKIQQSPLDYFLLSCSFCTMCRILLFLFLYIQANCIVAILQPHASGNPASLLCSQGIMIDQR